MLSVGHLKRTPLHLKSAYYFFKCTYWNQMYTFLDIFKGYVYVSVTAWVHMLAIFSDSVLLLVMG